MIFMIHIQLYLFILKVLYLVEMLGIVEHGWIKWVRRRKLEIGENLQHPEMEVLLNWLAYAILYLLGWMDFTQEA